jgi:hypothetical protein
LFSWDINDHNNDNDTLAEQAYEPQLKLMDKKHTGKRPKRVVPYETSPLGVDYHAWLFGDRHANGMQGKGTEGPDITATVFVS